MSGREFDSQFIKKLADNSFKSKTQTYYIQQCIDRSSSGVNRQFLPTASLYLVLLTAEYYNYHVAAKCLCVYLVDNQCYSWYSDSVTFVITQEETMYLPIYQYHNVQGNRKIVLSQLHLQILFSFRWNA